MKTKVFRLIIITALLQLSGLVDSAFSQMPAARSSQSFPDKLRNNLRYFIDEIPASETVSICVIIKTGSVYEAEFLGSGISHMLEHVIFKGSHDERSSKVMKIVASLGGSINGSTSYDYTMYQITVPKEKFRRALELLRDILFFPDFNEEEFLREQKVVFNEMRLRNDQPRHLLFRELVSTVFLTHPLHYPIIGTRELLAGITIAEIKEYHQRHYRAGNMVMAVAGGIDAGEARRQVREIFGAMRPDVSTGVVLPVEPRQLYARYRTIEGDYTMAYVGMGMKTPPAAHPDTYALDVLASILGSGKNSVLADELIRKKKAAYAASAHNYTPRETGMFYLSMTCAPENVQKAIAECTDIIERTKTELFSKQEVDRALNRIKKTLFDVQRTSSGRASVIASDLLYTGDPEYLKKYVLEVSKVTPQEIMQAANKYFSENSLSIVSLIPLDESTAKKQAAEEGVKPDAVPQRHVFENGMRLLTFEDKRFPTVSIQLSVPGGIFFEDKDNNGISNLLARTILTGTRKYTEEELIDIVESSGGSISAYANRNTVNIHIDVLSGELERAVTLISELIENAKYPDDAVEREKDIILQTIASRKDQIFGYGIYRLRQLMFAGHPYSRSVFGEADSVSPLVRADILRWHKNLFRPEKMILSVYGDIDRDSVLKLIRKRFRTRIAGDRREYVYPEIKFDQKYHNWQNPVLEDIKREQSIILISFPVPGLKDGQMYALELTSSILNAPNGILFKKIRDEMGLSYTLNSFMQRGIGIGAYVFYVAAEDKHIEKAKNAIVDAVSQIQNNILPEQILEDSIERVVGLRKIGLEEINALMSKNVRDELFGLGYKNYRNYEKHMRAIGKDDIVATVRRYLDFEKATVFILRGNKAAQ